jgi:enoyl-CoA hydratase/carnithine racemase
MPDFERLPHFETLLYDVRDNVATITLNQPDNRNALSTELLGELISAFEEALAYLRSQLSLAMSTEDIVEGVQAFFEKREPQWKGR